MALKAVEAWRLENKRIGTKLYQNYSRIRDGKGLNDYRVSKLTGINSGFFSVWKHKGSRPGFDKIATIADALGASTDDFYVGCETSRNDQRTGFCRHGQKGTRLYDIWADMRGRCYRKTDNSYPRYGGRGISVCDEWEDFVKFAEWANANGYDKYARRGECTIDRIDNDGNYCPDNCRWVSMKIQANNKSSNHLVEYDGEKYTITQLSEKFGIKKDTLRRRLLNGWSVYDAVTKPIGTNGVWRSLGNESQQCVYITTREVSKLIGAQRQVTYSLCADETIGYCYGKKNKKTYQIVPSKLAAFMEISEDELNARLKEVRECLL